MQLTATAFRKDLYRLIEQVRAGEELIIQHKGARFRVVPEIPASKLARLTPVAGWRAGSSPADEQRLQADMQTAWEEDWNAL